MVFDFLEKKKKEWGATLSGGKCVFRSRKAAQAVLERGSAQKDIAQCEFKGGNPPFLEEIERVLFYPKVRKYIRGSDDDIRHWVQAISLAAHMVSSVPQAQVIVEDDPDDDKFIFAAVAGKAKIIISGDAHLLRLKTYQGVSIITPSEFLARKSR